MNSLYKISSRFNTSKKHRLTTTTGRYCTRTGNKKYETWISVSNARWVMDSGWQEWMVDLVHYYELRNENTSIYFSFQSSVRVFKASSLLFEIQETEPMQLFVEPRNVLKWKWICVRYLCERSSGSLTLGKCLVIWRTACKAWEQISGVSIIVAHLHFWLIS